MAIYWTMSYFLLFFSFAELMLKKGKISKNVITIYIFLVATLMLIVVSGIRGPGTGIDDSQYVSFFNNSANQFSLFGFDITSKIYRYEPLFSFIAYMVSFFSHNGYVFLFFISLISISANATVFYKYSPLILCSLCLYSAHLYINKDLNQIRFGLCSAFGVLFLFALVNKKWIYCVLWFFLSVNSHATGYALILLIPFIFIKDRKIIPLCILLLSIPIGFIGGKKLIFSSLHLASSLGDRIAGYEGTVFDTVTPVLSLGNIKNIVFVIFFIFVYWRGGKIQATDKIPYWLLLIYSIGGAIRIMFSDFSILGGRVGNLFLQVEPLLLSFLILKIKKKYIAMFILFAMVTYYLIYNTVTTAQSISGYSISDYFQVF